MAPPAGKKGNNDRPEADLKPLPVSIDDITCLITLQEAIKKLTDGIIKAVEEGRSVTSVNKNYIVRSANKIYECVTHYSETDHIDLSINTLANSAAHEISREVSILREELQPNLLANNNSQIIELIKELKEENAAAVKTLQVQINKLKTDIKEDNQAATKQITSTYASIAGRQTKIRDAPGPALKTSISTHTPAPAAPPTTLPAIVVVSKDPAASREDTMRNLRLVLPIRETNYAPARVTPIIKNGLKLEFDSERDRDDALRRICGAENAKVTAEVARRLRPMAILKGISRDVAAEDLVGVLLQQNPELGEFDTTHISLKFKRDNKNPALYNAVLLTSPLAFRALIALQRARVDFQRVHVEEFSPFLQCHRCLQFGHTSTHCKNPALRCAHCAKDGHVHKDCPNDFTVSPDGTVTKPTETNYNCFNCTAHNIKFCNNSTDKKYPTAHKATSDSCPIVRAMKSRTRQNIDYGTAP